MSVVLAVSMASNADSSTSTAKVIESDNKDDDTKNNKEQQPPQNQPQCVEQEDGTCKVRIVTEEELAR